MSSNPDDDIVVTGMGLRTPVGNDVVQSCATIRCGMARFAEWGGGVLDGAEQPLAVGSLEPETGDDPWMRKVEDLVEQPLHEALWQAQIYDGSEYRAADAKRRIAAFLALPSPGRPGIDDDAWRKFSIEAKRHCIAPASADAVELLALDHAAGLAAMARAVESLQAGEVDVAVVGGFDSHLHGPWLQQLDAAKAICTDTRGVGFVPGEAVGFAVLETRAHAEARGVAALGRITAVHGDEETQPIAADAPIEATALSRVIRACLEGRARGPDIHRVITDLNGERWRSLEWALAETRCLGRMPAGWQLWHPADCTGDLGAASGLVALAVALRALAGGYAGPGAVLLTSASFRGSRMAMVVESVDAAPTTHSPE